LRTRGTEDKKIINARIKQAKWEISKAKHYKYQIVNDNLKTAKAKLKNVFLTEIKKNA
jgi:guanylate kinase